MSNSDMPRSEIIGGILGALSLGVISILSFTPWNLPDVEFLAIGIILVYIPFSFLMGGYIGMKGARAASITRGAIHGACILGFLSILLVLIGFVLYEDIRRRGEWNKALRSVVESFILGAIPGVIGGAVGMKKRTPQQK
jgi:hypothetical protein